MRQELDTIAAISTAVSESGIGIIRISGPEAVRIADRIYRSKGGKKHLRDVQSHTIHYGYIMQPEEPSHILDEVLVSVMLAPRTFTAEDTVEINCHGGVYAMRRVLEAVIAAGARPAEPGEFTKRAFLNGRIDLSQAEAVMDVISARNAYALHNAVKGLEGYASGRIRKLRSDMIYQTAKIESALDDPEHYSLDGYDEELLELCGQWQRELETMIRTADEGRLMQEGIRTVILGRPNAGKSSLMNSLLGEERAIVTQIAGTTRDVLHETLQFGGITLNLIDTAGIRETEDIVEKIGVDRALDSARDADLILYVVDGSAPLTGDDDRIMQEAARQRQRGCRTIFLLNKSDLTQAVDYDTLKDCYRRAMQSAGMNETGTTSCKVFGKTSAEEQILNADTVCQMPPVLSTTLKDGAQPEALRDLLQEMFYHGELSFNDEVMITSVRQKDLLIQANASLQKLRASLEAGMPEDFYTIDLMDAYAFLGQILGEQVSEDLVNEIFDKFCMGK